MDISFYNSIRFHINTDLRVYEWLGLPGWTEARVDRGQGGQRGHLGGGFTHSAMLSRSSVSQLMVLREAFGQNQVT